MCRPHGGNRPVLGGKHCVSACANVPGQPTLTESKLLASGRAACAKACPQNVNWFHQTNIRCCSGPSPAASPTLFMPINRAQRLHKNNFIRCQPGSLRRELCRMPSYPRPPRGITRAPQLYEWGLPSCRGRPSLRRLHTQRPGSTMHAMAVRDSHATPFAVVARRRLYRMMRGTPKKKSAVEKMLPRRRRMAEKKEGGSDLMLRVARGAPLRASTRHAWGRGGSGGITRLRRPQSEEPPIFGKVGRRGGASRKCAMGRLAWRGLRRSGCAHDYAV